MTPATSSGAWTLPLQAIDDVAQATCWLRFRAPGSAERVDPVALEPGHFFMLSPATPSGVIFLGRPFSIGDVRDGTWHFLLRVLGRGTAWLRSLAPGAPVRVVGPLGRPFQRPRRAIHRMVAGGVGLAPFFYLARAIRAEQPGVRIELFYGERGRAAHTAFDSGEESLFDHVGRFTDDGSLGTAGTVVGGAEARLADDEADPGGGDVAWYACGPHPMLRALAVLFEARGVHGAQFSLEERMGCGFGVCQACVVPNRAAPPSRTGPPRWRLLCLEGPVVDPREVAW